MKLVLVFVLITLLAGCAGQREFIDAGARDARVEVPHSAAIRLSIPTGEVIVRGVPGNQLIAHVEFRCQENDRGCARRVSEAGFETGADTTAIVVALKPRSMMSWRDVQTRVTVEVPHDRALFVDMGAGDLDILDMHNCVSLDMYAGEASLQLDRAVVGSVALDVGTGDTSLKIGDHRIDGRRALLVGAELEWHDGDGWCQVYGDLQFGELSVHLR